MFQLQIYKAFRPLLKAKIAVVPLLVVLTYGEHCRLFSRGENVTPYGGANAFGNRAREGGARSSRKRGGVTGE